MDQRVALLFMSDIYHDLMVDIAGLKAAKLVNNCYFRERPEKVVFRNFPLLSTICDRMCLSGSTGRRWRGCANIYIGT